MVPRCSMIPVNIVQVSLQGEVGAKLRDENILDLRMREFWREGKWESIAAGNFGSVEKHQFVDNSGGERRTVYRGARFEQDAQYIAAAEFLEDETQVEETTKCARANNFHTKLPEIMGLWRFQRRRGEDQKIVVARRYDARFRREFQLRIENYAQQAAPALQSAAIGQKWIVGQDGADAGEQRVGSMAHAVNLGAGFLGRDPRETLLHGRRFLRWFGGFGQSELAVQSQCGFQGDQRLLRANPAGEGLVQFSRFVFANPREDFDSRRAQASESTA